MTELELRLQGQEKEMRSQVNKCQDLQLQLEKTKVELIEKERILNKTRDEVVRSTAQYDQAAAKVLDFSGMTEKVLGFYI
jgi:centromere protein F